MRTSRSRRSYAIRSRGACDINAERAKGEKRPADVVGAAFKVMRIATAEINEDRRRREAAERDGCWPTETRHYRRADGSTTGRPVQTPRGERAARQQWQ
jgi:hypothetical protein